MSAVAFASGCQSHKLVPVLEQVLDEKVEGEPPLFTLLCG